MFGLIRRFMPSALTAVLLGSLLPFAPSAAVAATPTTTVLTVSKNPVLVGEAFTLTATVSPNPGGGIVRWIRDNTYMGYDDGVIDPATGMAQVTWSANQVATNNWQANFTGSGEYSASTSAPLALTVTQGTTSTSLSSAKSPAAVGEVVPLTAEVTPNPGGGTVTFVYENVTLETVAVDGSGRAQRNIIVKPGSVQASATFNGLGPLGLSTGSLVQVGKYSTTTALGLSVNPVVEGADLVLAGTVSPRPSGGSVTFVDAFGGTAAAVGTVAVAANGVASLATRTLAPGTHELTASFDGTATDFPSASAPQTLTVVPDTSVLASNVGVQYSTFYPAKDGYRDTLAILGTLGETATITVRVLDGADQIVKTARLANQPAGRYSVKWNGRRPNGSLLAAGTYRITQRIEDWKGNVATFSARTVLSDKRLVLQTMRVNLPAARYSSSARNVDGWVGPSASRFAGGLVVHGGSTMASYGKAFYRVHIPVRAFQLRSLFFCAQGAARRGYRPPFVGLSNFAAGRIDWVQIPSKLSSCWGFEAKGSDATLRSRYVRRGLIEGSIAAGGLYYMSYDAARVGVVVRYAELVEPRLAGTDEVPSVDPDPGSDEAWDLDTQRVSDPRWSGRMPKRLRPLVRRSVDDWLRDDPPEAFTDDGSADAPTVSDEG